MNLDMATRLSRPVTATAGLLLLVAATAVVLAQAPAAPASPESVKKAEDVLTAAKTALGGQKLASVKTIVASGRTRRVRGDNLVPIEFEMLVELPDKYVRVDEFPAEDADPTSSGFNGDGLIQIPPPPAMPAGAGRGMPPGGAGGPPADAAAAGPGRGAPPPGAGPAPGPPPSAPATAGAAPAGPPPQPPPGAPPAAQASAGAPAPGAAMPGGRGMPGPGRGGPPMDPRRARINTVKQDFARLALGLFAASPAYPLTFSYAAMAEAPQGRADVLDVKGEGGFTLRYFVNNETHLPIMVTWTTPPTNVIVTAPGQPPPKTVAPGAVVVAGPPAPPAGAPKEEMDKYAKDVVAIRAKAQSTPVEHRLYFADYREVDGLHLPFRLRRAIGSETTEETTFDRFRINAKIDPRKFEAVK
jgi:hypothetical protein